MKPSVPPNQRGYSLSEMLVVVAIIGILSLVTVPNFISIYRGAKLKTSVQQFTTDLRATRQRAVTTIVPMKVSWQQGAGKREYRVYRGAPTSTGITWTQVNPGRWTTTDIRLRLLDEIAYFAAPAATPLTDQDDPADGWLDVIYLPNGQVSFPSGSTTTEGKVVLKTDMSTGRATYTVTVNTSGRVSTE
ncbi:MAG: prepilin-type N-terminal cleavage/methylation domain-containing protein [Thermoanaerobaculia bacterium]